MDKIPKRIELSDLVKKDFELFNKVFDPASKQIRVAIDNKNYLVSFLLSWALIEQIILPNLIRFIAHRLKIKELPDIKKLNTSQLISGYYFLSQDEKEYKYLNKETKKSTEFIIKNILVPLLDKISGKEPIPVLMLYAQGWNDCRKKTIKNLEKLMGK
ncbi:MAG: hypothetical protein UT16_C0001G0015 [Candidatus Azambacteria bacterium GW2011_GWA2_39_10]|uniref:Uncharacterized protein n=1 Tax=Candidatus Azambacteria bacterium GW2011_GWA2_39_10 TaxID=1618611 RepID=A0A0G0P485_9BACT|nr:MAG: hypothetical protein UT16_C0001G0015 [Candidatus Azambacteria bacterium GW2011_GWA2_39_10]